ncbi:peptidoglycan DD-metalloendopeptidase family protein [bacterium]|nr:peptidoglycan DD-metalloendopeptidase family protein [bacterium]
MKSSKSKVILIAIAVIFGFFSYVFYFEKNIAKLAENSLEPLLIDRELIKKDRVEKIEIVEGSTYGELMENIDIEYKTVMAIYEAAQPVYDLVKVRVGRFVELIFDKNTDVFKELRYKVDTEEELIVTRNVDKTATGTVAELIWQAELRAIPYEVRSRVAEGTVESSMYQAALDNNIDIRAIIELANAFQWTIDFAMDPRVGDTFKFLYEERYLDGEYVMPGQVLAGIYVNDGKKNEVYYFVESEDNKGFFDQDGNSVQKIFLRAPVAFKYISSGFTTGPRYVGGKYQRYTSSHRAIDYAAPIGTPIRAVGKGTVVFAGWNSAGYGYYTSLRHNGTYTTNYAHQSRIAVKYGQKVEQGEVIGYVGSTGFSTGPHLHYEMVKNGVKINPLQEILPPGKPIKEENKARFVSELEKFKELLN